MRRTIENNRLKVVLHVVLAGLLFFDSVESRAAAGKEADGRNVSAKATWRNSLGMKFAPAGDCLFCVWETRVQDFKVFVDATGYHAVGGMYSLTRCGWKQLGHTWKDPGFYQDPWYPVVGVSWNDANAFCQWLTEKERKEGVLIEGQSYRLPTHEEWGRAAGNDLYPWGNEWPPPEGAGNYAGAEARESERPSAWGTLPEYWDGYPQTSPVGNFKPNRQGLYDMGGNVWEWCSDWYRKEMNSPELRSRYPELKEDGGGRKYRLVRGSSWRYGVSDGLLSSYCNGNVPEFRNGSLGFRCVISNQHPFAAIEHHYGVPIRHRIHDGYFPYDLDGSAGPSPEEISPSDYRLFSEGLNRALARYPHRLLQKNLREIRLAKNAHSPSAHIPVGGTYRKDILWVFSPEHAEEVFCHEFSSILMRNQRFPFREWRECNENGFQYKTQIDKRSMADSSLTESDYSLRSDSGQFEIGFLNPYCHVSIEEDFNEFSRFAFAHPRLLEELVLKYGRVNAKRSVLRRFYEKMGVKLE